LGQLVKLGLAWGYPSHKVQQGLLIGPNLSPKVVNGSFNCMETVFDIFVQHVDRGRGD